MGWTDDPDEEGLIEENPFIFAVIAVILLAVAGILYFVGIDYDPGWFEGQNLVSTMGIIFLIIFIPAIAISTFTGRSDLVKWEAIFLFISVFMICIGNNFDIIDALSSKVSTWMEIDWNVKDFISIVLIITLIATAISAAFGKGISIGSAAIVAVCLFALYAINSGLSLDNFFGKLGAAIEKTTSGVIGADLGTGLGIGLTTAAAGAAIGSFVPGIGTALGAGVGFLVGLGGYIIGENQGWW